MPHRAVLMLALLCHLALLPRPFFAQNEEEVTGESPPSTSPDGKFLVRLPNDEQRLKLGENDVPKPALYEVKTGRHIACEQLDSMEAFVSSLGVVWSKDSTRVAFNHRVRGRYLTTDLYELKDGKCIQLATPEEPLQEFLERDKAAQIKKLGLQPDVDQRQIYDEFTVRRWIDAATVEIDAKSFISVPKKAKPADKDENAENVFVEARVRFILQLDAKEKAKEWKILKSEPIKEG
jgi:hypothetical protein